MLPDTSQARDGLPLPAGEQPLPPLPALILATKLYAPRARRDLVPRPRLTARLDAALDGRLTLVSAPAGFGKTTLISDWLGQSHGGPAARPVAWLSLMRPIAIPLASSNTS